MRFRFEYSISRQFPYRHFTPVVLVVATICFILLTVLNVALTGYETVTTFVDDFNATQRFWYDRFLLGRGLQPGTLCDPHELNVGDSFITNSSLFEWKLATITKSKNTTHNIVYKGSTLESCDINAIYMTADLRTRTTDTIAVITCQDVDGFEFLAKTTYQMTFLAGLYAPPLLEAIPKPYGLGNTGKPESVVLGLMMNLSASDFQPVWDTVLQTAHMPAIISGRIFSTPCPASSGVAAPCANDPHPIKIDRVTTVFPNGSFNAFDAYLPPSNTNKPLIELDWLPRIANLIQVIVASIRIDLGNPSPNNFILHPSALSRTLSNTFPAVGLTNSTDSLLYQANVHPEIYGIQGMLPLTLAGPARIQVVFLCRFQQWKAFGALFISVLVATLSMFASGWALFMLLASSWVKRGSEAANCCDRCSKQLEPKDQ